MRPLLLCLALAAAPATAADTLHYLHGRYLEEHAADEPHPQHGRYQIDAILEALGRDGAHVLADRRPRDTDVSAYADALVARLRRDIAAGTPAREIVVIGASKGAVIAALVSSRLREPELRYVIMAGCNEWLEREYAPRFTGHVLAIHDRSDEIAGSCAAIAARSGEIVSFAEVELDTGRGHGFLYRPLRAWLRPLRAWLSRPARPAALP